jgi:adenylyltransferase/sulfurtransferase
VDRDFVELNNLQRQILFDEEDANRIVPKAVAAVEKLKRINSVVQLEAEVSDVNPKNVEKLIKGFDLVVDGTDNMETRMVLNDACLKLRTPWIYGACIGSEGMTMNILPGKGPCLQCLVRDVPVPGSIATCDTAGIVNTIPSIIASLQVTEALKILLGDSDVRRDLTYVDAWTGRFESLKIEKLDTCEACGKGHLRFLSAQSTAWVTSLCGRNAVQIMPQGEGALSLEHLAHSLDRITKTSYNGFLLRFEVDGFEFNIFPNGRAIIKGTTDTSVARRLYAKYVGT